MPALDDALGTGVVCVGESCEAHATSSDKPKIARRTRCAYHEFSGLSSFGSSTLIDVAEAAAHEPWFNQTLTPVNDSVVRLGVLKGEFHFQPTGD